MAFTAATSPLCTWLIAACVTNSVAGLTGNDAPVSSGPLGRRLKRRIARSKQLTAESWLGIGVQAASRSGQSLVAFCESGLSELGTFCSLQGFKECNNLKQESLFGDGFFGESLRGLRGLRGSGSKSIRAGRRAVAGETRLVQIIPFVCKFCMKCMPLLLRALFEISVEPYVCFQSFSVTKKWEIVASTALYSQNMS